MEFFLIAAQAKSYPVDVSVAIISLKKFCSCLPCFWCWISQDSLENRYYIPICMFIFIYMFGSLVHVVMKAEKCPAWKLEYRESQWCGSAWVQRSEDLGAMVWILLCVWKPQSQERLRVQEKVEVSAQVEMAGLHFLCLFVLFRPSMDWIMTIHISEHALLYLVYWFKF